MIFRSETLTKANIKHLNVSICKYWSFMFEKNQFLGSGLSKDWLFIYGPKIIYLVQVSGNVGSFAFESISIYWVENQF